MNASIGISSDDKLVVTTHTADGATSFILSIAGYQGLVHLHDITSAIRLRKVLSEALDRALLGDARQVTDCPACNGVGMFSKGEPGSDNYNEWPCMECDGSGKTGEEPDTVEWRELRRLLIAEAEEETVK